MKKWKESLKARIIQSEKKKVLNCDGIVLERVSRITNTSDARKVRTSNLFQSI